MADFKSLAVTSWLEKAYQDLLAAERLLMGSFPLTDIASFHAQRAAEKAIKAYLTWYDTVFPKTHSLVALCLQVEDDSMPFAPQRLHSRHTLSLRDTQATLPISVWQMRNKRWPWPGTFGNLYSASCPAKLPNSSAPISR